MKILIYMPKNGLKPIGGPAGYLYNLKKGLDEIGCGEVYFLPETEEKRDLLLKKIYHTIPNGLRVYLLSIIKKAKSIVTNRDSEMEIMYENYKTLLFGSSNLPEDYNSYDVIHFHTTFELYKEKKQLENYSGKVILNSHSPQPNHQEYIALYSNHPRREEIYAVVKEADEYAFNRADIILFPCHDAEEPYYNNWDEYAGIHIKNEKKYRYLVTGLKKCIAKQPKIKIRRKYGIPQNAFLISYIGRHNEIKGYNILKKIGENILSKYSNVYFLVAGKEGPIYGLENKRWIEAGWTDDPHSIMKASDLFILPNKETYFDLIMLEVMSLGVPVLASNTGGNKYFSINQCNGVKLYNSQDECEEILEELINNTMELQEMGIENEAFFDKNLNEKIFAKNYIEKLRDMVENEE